jgi:biotin synthase
MSSEAQMLCFMGGANSIFYGEKLLTTGNPETEQDLEMLHEAGMRALTPALEQEAEAGSVELPSQTASAAP